MEYIEYYNQIVKNRQSCRDFASREVSQDTIDDILKYYKECPNLVVDVDTDLVIYDGSIREKLGDTIGYNGFSVEAPKYAILFSEKKEHYLENAGFLIQGVTLKLTQIGLSACWLTINDQDKADQILAHDRDKTVSAILAFGYSNEGSTNKRIDIKSPSNVKLVESSSKAAPKIAIDDLLYSKYYGNKINKELLYTELMDSLLSVSMSQSFFNRQPYRVIVDDDIISLIGIDDEMTGAIDKYLNYGIAMFNFYAVMESVRKNAPMWSFAVPDRELKLPDNAQFIAKCNI